MKKVSKISLGVIVVVLLIFSAVICERKLVKIMQTPLPKSVLTFEQLSTVEKYDILVLRDSTKIWVRLIDITPDSSFVFTSNGAEQIRGYEVIKIIKDGSDEWVEKIKKFLY